MSNLAPYRNDEATLRAQLDEANKLIKVMEGTHKKLTDQRRIQRHQAIRQILPRLGLTLFVNGFMAQLAQLRTWPVVPVLCITACTIGIALCAADLVGLHLEAKKKRLTS